MSPSGFFVQHERSATFSHARRNRPWRTCRRPEPDPVILYSYADRITGLSHVDCAGAGVSMTSRVSNSLEHYLQNVLEHRPWRCKGGLNAEPRVELDS